jgi:hypothetical protein
MNNNNTINILKNGIEEEDKQKLLKAATPAENADYIPNCM